MRRAKIMKLDLHKRKASYVNWLTKVENNGWIIEDLSPQNSSRLLSYLEDMSKGQNVSKGTVRGNPRSWDRLVTLKNRMIWILKRLEERGVIDVAKIREDEVESFFLDIIEEKIVRLDGRPYKSIPDFIKTFKAFWSWMLIVEKKKRQKKKCGLKLDDVTEGLYVEEKKAEWVYMTPTQMKSFIDSMRVKKYKMLTLFLFDTTLRPPAEVLNCKGSDLIGDADYLKLKDEYSKTFGRTIEIRISKDELRKYLKEEGIGESDYLFEISVKQYNRYLKRHAEKMFGDAVSPGGKLYKEITEYDIRHISMCYWSPKYANRKVFHKRVGVTNENRVTYYTEDIGLTDSLDGTHEEDPWAHIVKSEKDVQVERLARENEELRLRLLQLYSVPVSQPCFSFQSVNPNPFAFVPRVNL